MTDKQSEFIEQLFSTISSDPTTPAELKISLLRLQLPIHKLCMSEPHFITNANHPARRTLFICKRLSALSNNDPGVVRKIDFILSELFKASPNTSKFASINQQLDKLTILLEKKSPSNKPQYKDELAQLKHVLNTNIKRCIQGYTIPAPCQDITLKLWPKVLFQLLKTHGEDSLQWDNAITLYNNLLESIQTINSRSQYFHLKDNFMNFVRNNNSMLLLYHQESIVEPAIKSLIGHYNQMIDSSKYSTNTNHHKQKITPQVTNVLPESIKPGVWCEIYIDDVTPSRRLRLSLINLDTGMLVFVNRKGIKKLEKEISEFNEELKRGLSKAYKHDALFTRPSTKTEFQKIG